MIKETFRKFETRANECPLVKGQDICPDTIIGIDYHTGSSVLAGCFGTVRRVYYNPSHHSVMVLVEDRTGEVN